jgi:hypothetical protein
LASQYEQLGVIGEPDLVGVDAALIILRELVAEANRVAVTTGRRRSRRVTRLPDRPVSKARLGVSA